MLLERCDGPECPRCGCQDAEILVEPPPNPGSTWFARGRARCRHCNLRFSFRELPGGATPEPEAEADHGCPTYPVKACPECGSDRVLVTSTRRPIRHHKCPTCGLRFKSIEPVTEKTSHL